MSYTGFLQNHHTTFTFSSDSVLLRGSHKSVPSSSTQSDQAGRFTLEVADACGSSGDSSVESHVSLAVISALRRLQKHAPLIRYRSDPPGCRSHQRRQARASLGHSFTTCSTSSSTTHSRSQRLREQALASAPAEGVESATPCAQAVSCHVAEHMSRRRPPQRVDNARAWRLIKRKLTKEGCERGSKHEEYIPPGGNYAGPKETTASFSFSDALFRRRKQ